MWPTQHGCWARRSRCWSRAGCWRRWSWTHTPGSSAAAECAPLLLDAYRSVLADRLSAGDLHTPDHLRTEDGPDAVGHRGDLTVHGSRTIRLGRRH
ncbi:hypothetical protein [Streptomyces sp. NPDC058045]|uniref:hypothetical protein n=1 Tax=Streptomyces sp. NPDC058045 TaxID=3346311 RepID=UPI0036EA0A47